MNNIIQNTVTVILIYFCCYVGLILAYESNFILVEEIATCQDAAIECENRGMVLASIHNTAENEEAVNICPLLCIIGGIREVNTAQFQWVDNTPWDFPPPWLGSSPDVPLDRPACILILQTAEWDDFPADSTGGPFICAPAPMEETVIDLNVFEGTYEFEILGRPMRFYICESQGILYWTGSDLEHMEYTYIVGRDIDGATQLNVYSFEVECDIFRLYGDDILTGFWKLRYNKRSKEYILYERFPELSEAEQEDWNIYTLKRISSQIVANPEIRGFQCFVPSSVFPVRSASTPFCWTSSLLQPQQLIANHFFGGNDEGCWLFTTVQGNAVKGGFIYDFREEWDGGLLIVRWDDRINHDEQQIVGNRCLGGSMFVVRTDQYSAIFSYQCEDRITGDQYLTFLEESDDCNESICPLWTEDESTAEPAMDVTMEPTINPTSAPTYNTSNRSETESIVFDEDDPYRAIISALEQCTGDQTEEYLSMFIEQHVTDQLLPFLHDLEWEQLIPSIAFRSCCRNVLNLLN